MNIEFNDLHLNIVSVKLWDSTSLWNHFIEKPSPKYRL